MYSSGEEFAHGSLRDCTAWHHIAYEVVIPQGELAEFLFSHYGRDIMSYTSMESLGV
jgi:hypothetical protein